MTLRDAVPRSICHTYRPDSLMWGHSSNVDPASDAWHPCAASNIRRVIAEILANRSA